MEDLLLDLDRTVTAILTVIDQSGNSNTLVKSRVYSIDTELLLSKEKNDVGVEKITSLPVLQTVQVPQANDKVFALEVVAEEKDKVNELPDTGENLDWTLTATGILLLTLVAFLKKKQSLAKL